MDNPDVRWIQRFQNFDRAFHLLSSALISKGLNEFTELEMEGLNRRFVNTYELAWKTMKDYLDENGIIIIPLTATNVIKEAFSAKVIGDGQVWIDMMLDRNRLSHIYDFNVFKEVLENISNKYYSAISGLYNWLSEKSKENE